MKRVWIKSVAAFAIALVVMAENVWAQQVDDEEHQVRQISGNVHFMWQQRKFDQLETWAKEYRDGRKRFPSGGWYIYVFYTGFHLAFDDRETLPRARALWNAAFEEWKKAYPQSPTPYIANAVTLEREAWAIRGGGYASQVWAEDMEKFTSTLREARKSLVSHKKIASTDPYYYALMADIGVPLGEPKKEFFGRLAEGLKRTPDYIGYYYRAARYLSPSWGGDAREFVAWADHAAKVTSASTYAGIFHDYRGEDFAKYLMFADADHREKLKRGMADAMERYPTLSVRRDMMHLACLMRDPEEVDKNFVAWRKMHRPSAPVEGTNPAEFCQWNKPRRNAGNDPAVLPPPPAEQNTAPQKAEVR